MARRPLAVIGLDAADPVLILQWAERGFLPNLKALLDRGCHGLTGGPELVSEHGIWVSVFSGISRGQHGYYYFRQLIPGHYDLREATGNELDAPPFWSSDAASGLNILAVDLPDIPLTPGVTGIQLANWAIHLGWLSKNPDHQPKSIPADFLEQAERRFGARDVILENSTATLEQDTELFQRLAAQVDRRGELLQATVREAPRPFDLLLTVFAESHTAGHQFWKYLPGARGIDAVPNSPLENALRDIYVKIDRQIGLLLEAMPADTNVVLCSTVGIHDCQPTGRLIEDLLRLTGIQTSPPPQRVPMRPLDVARRILPEWVRVALSKNFSRDARERLMADQWRARTDWTRSRAFAVPGTYTSYVRVNLRDREPNGIVEPGDAYERVLDEVEAELAKVIDPVTGQSPFALVTRTVPAFGLSDPPAVLPDLFIAWRAAAHEIARLVHPLGELTQPRPEWYRPTDHHHNGFFAASGPGVGRRGDIGMVDVLDIAPTLLGLLDRPPASRMTGKRLNLS